MYRLIVSNSTSSDNPYLQPLLKHLEEIEEQKVRVYYTHIETDPSDTADGSKEQLEEKSFTFVTTSKNIHLELGRLGWDAQSYLVGLLEYEFQQDKYMNQILLCIQPDKGAILITRTEEIDGTVSFTLSPAN